MKVNKRSRLKKIAANILFDIIGGFFYSTGIYIFAKNSGFAPGGLSGLALIINHLWRLPIGLTTLILNIPLIIFSFKFLGKSFLIKSVRSMIICNIFIDIIFPYFPSYSGSPVLAALYYGIFLGTGLAIFYMRGSSSGGTDFLTMTIKTIKPYFSIGFVTMSIDLIIISLGWPVFGNIDAVLYGVISTFIASVVIDKIMYRVGAAKMLVIITKHADIVAQKISEVSERGSTSIRAVGTFTKDEKNVLICACSNSQAYAIKKEAQKIDEKIFIILTDASKIFGEGFIN